LNGKAMREALSNKFNGISHKWLKFELDDEVFKKIKTKLKESLEADLYNEKDLRKILKHFKRKDFCWVKYLSCRGTSFIICKCQVIDENNNKVDFELLGHEVLYAQMLDGTPKGLKLFKVNKKELGADIDWDKPDDGITDELYPPIEEEMTQLGYELYKMTILEKEGKLQEYIDSFY
jgi:hypothetical protein